MPGNADTRVLARRVADAAGMSRSEGVRRRGLAICLSGIDGSGKTTLSTNLVKVFREAGVPARRLHIFAWHQNLVRTPWIIFRNRFFGREILVFDRSIFDNVALFFENRPRRLLPAVMGIIRALYPRFDHLFYLEAPYEVIAHRRPEIDPPRYRAMSGAYRAIIARSGHVPVESDHLLLGTVLARMAGMQAGDGRP